MAYIPPHKRHSEDSRKPSPTPELLVPQFKKNLNLSSSRKDSNKAGKIVYAVQAISKWFAIGLDDTDQFPSSVHLKPVLLEFFEHKFGRIPLALLKHDVPEQSGIGCGNGSQPPWISIAENVLEDLLYSFQSVRNEMGSQNGAVKPSLAARFGKILFHGDSIKQKSVKNKSANVTTLRQLRRLFYNSVPDSYMKYILEEGALKVGVDFEVEKDIYHVKLSDSTQPDATITCKCRVIEDCGKLQIYKIELNNLRHMVADISCLEKNLDLRLMLSTKRSIYSLSDDDMKSIRDLIESAILDSDVMGGLRWPLCLTSSGDKYNVIGVWHTKATTYVSTSLRLKVRHADRFDFKTSTGEASREVTLYLKKLASMLQEQNADTNLISETLKDDLRVIWENFLCCEQFLAG